MYTISKVDLVAKMLKGNWTWSLLSSSMQNEDIFIFGIYFHNLFFIKDFLTEILTDKYCTDSREETTSIEVYLPYHDFVKFYKNSLYKAKHAQFWRNCIKDEDLLAIHKD